MDLINLGVGIIIGIIIGAGGIVLFQKINKDKVEDKAATPKPKAQKKAQWQKAEGKTKAPGKLEMIETKKKPAKKPKKIAKKD
jgi:hypothetical protein